MRTVVFLNPSAGTPKHPHLAVGRRRIAAALGEAGLEADVRLVDGCEVAAAVEGAVAAGTLRSAATVLIGTDTPLAVLPRGTFNHFAKDIGVPLALRAAIAAIATGHATTVDVGEVNGHIFLNNSAVGAYPRLVAHREAVRRRFGLPKWPAVAYGFVRALTQPPRLRLFLDLDDEIVSLSTWFVLVSNNRYRMRRLGYARRAGMTRGELGVYATLGPNRPRATAAFARMLAGRPPKDDVLETTSHGFRLASSAPELLVSLDGELVRLVPPLLFRVRPRALTVIAPSPERHRRFVSRRS